MGEDCQLTGKACGKKGREQEKGDENEVRSNIYINGKKTGIEKKGYEREGREHLWFWCIANELSRLSSIEFKALKCKSNINVMSRPSSVEYRR